MHYRLHKIWTPIVLFLPVRARITDKNDILMVVGHLEVPVSLARLDVNCSAAIGLIWQIALA